MGKIRFNVLEFTTRVDDTIFDMYDRSRRGVEFGYLIDVYRYKYGIVKDVLGSFWVPVFNKDNNVDLYFMEVTETEKELTYYETEKTFETLRRGLLWSTI